MIAPLPLLRRFWWALPMLALTAWALIAQGRASHWHKRYTQQVAAMVETKRRIDAAATQYATAVAARQAADAQSKDKADAQFADASRDARAATDAYIVRAKAAQCRGGTAAQAPAATGSGTRADPLPVMADHAGDLHESDARACSAATVTAITLREWALRVGE